MNTKKIFAITLIAFGLAIIIYNCWLIAGAFRDSPNMPEIFKIKNKTVTSATKLPAGDLNFALQQQFTNNMQNGVSDFFDIQLPQFLNYICWTLLVWLFMSAGVKIAEIGIKML